MAVTVDCLQRCAALLHLLLEQRYLVYFMEDRMDRQSFKNWSPPPSKFLDAMDRGLRSEIRKMSTLLAHTCTDPWSAHLFENSGVRGRDPCTCPVEDICEVFKTLGELIGFTSYKRGGTRIDSMLKSVSTFRQKHPLDSVNKALDMAWTAIQVVMSALNDRDAFVASLQILAKQSLLSNVVSPLRVASNSDQIRLYRIFEDQTGEIRGALVSFDIRGCPPFHAVSYEWDHDDELYGGSAQQNFIFHGGGRIAVGRNLYSFLLSYRAAKRVKWKDVIYLWADQISINQGNIEERNHQVKYMDQVFTKAKTVIAWLREPAAVRQQESVEDFFNAISKNDYHFDSRGGLGRSNHPGRDQFLNHTFWSRLWIQQEVVLANDLVFASGSAYCPAKTLGTVRGIRENHSEPALEMVFENKCIRWRSLSEALILFSSKRCSNVRDKVYGIQGLVRPDERIEVDYCEAPADLFRRTVHAVLSQGEYPLPQHFEQARTNSLYTLGRHMAFEHEVIQIVHKEVTGRVLQDRESVKWSGERPWTHLNEDSDPIWREISHSRDWEDGDATLAELELAAAERELAPPLEHTLESECLDGFDESYSHWDDRDAVFGELETVAAERQLATPLRRTSEQEFLDRMIFLGVGMRSSVH